LFLPAYACLAWAVWQRRWVLLLASVLVACSHIAWISPDFVRDRRFDMPASAAAAPAVAEVSPTLRVFFANVANRNTHYDAMLQEIAHADPDIIVLVEYGWGWHDAFIDAPVMAPYIHGSGHLQSHIGSVNLFSRLPLKTELQNWIDGRAVHTVDVEFGGKTLRLVGLHAPRPIPGLKYNFRKYWQEMLPLLASEQRPLVIVGDFNVTQHSLVYAQLRSANLRSAHEDRGRGYATTWPNGQIPLPPIRIDQAFLSPEVECASITEGIGEGSDHRPLILDVRLWSASAASAQ
jgi:endonuclease/exonuclease/phosphatase (EEP) superfamily protein YafD